MSDAKARLEALSVHRARVALAARLKASGADIRAVEAAAAELWRLSQACGLKVEVYCDPQNPRRDFRSAIVLVKDDRVPLWSGTLK